MCMSGHGGQRLTLGSIPNCFTLQTFFSFIYVLCMNVYHLSHWELQMVVSHQADTETQSPVLCKSSKYSSLLCHPSSPSLFHLISIRQALSLNLDSPLAGLPGFQVPGILLSPLSWESRSVPPHLALCVGAGYMHARRVLCPHG